MKKFSFLFILSIIFFSAASTQAADFLFSNAPQAVSAGSDFMVEIVADAGDKTINALSGKIIFDNRIFEIKKVLTGNSGINLWIEAPVERANGEINFAGIVVNGFSGQIPLFSAIISAKNIGQGNLTFSGIEALLNDGKGTADEARAHNISINIVAASPDQKPAQIFFDDQEPPDEFFPQIMRSPNIFNGDYSLIFATSDKQSGIKKYKILEQRIYRLFGYEYIAGSWREAQSPYRLRDQKMKSNIFVLAIDQYGNERLERIDALSPIAWYENRLIWSIIILLAAILIVVIALYEKRRDTRR